MTLAVVVNAGKGCDGMTPLTGERYGGEVNGTCCTTGGEGWGVVTRLLGEESGAHPVKVGTWQG